MIKRLKIAKLNKQIEEVCLNNGYTLHGEIKKCSIGENAWTFAVQTQEKVFLVKLIVPFGSHNTGLCIYSPTYISAVATLFGMRGIGGVIDIPITREYKFKLPESAFGFDARTCEKIFLIYPHSTYLAVREPDKTRLTEFRVGLKCCDISIHDGASFRYLLENSN